MQPPTPINVPEWHKNATIYEVNLRHYTKDGTFEAFENHLPRLKKLGIDILWLMPIHPVSQTKRKGDLGSPYAVDNYLEVDEQAFGSMEDFCKLLKAIHDEGMHCIIDWVPAHTGWDNPWITEHPDWYVKDKNGDITEPIDPHTGEPRGWDDVAALDYNVPDLQRGMIDAMKFWVDIGTGIDGFRMDHAEGLPVHFWEEVLESLLCDPKKPLFMLAEAEKPTLVNNGTFVMDYGWHMFHTLKQLAVYQGAVSHNEASDVEKKVTARDIDRVLAKYVEEYERGYKMYFLSNHDENSWSGSEFARFGDGYEAFAVLVATFDGMPLLYSGMETGMDRRLNFFDRSDGPIDWSRLPYKYEKFYEKLFSLKHRNEALWNGEHGGKLQKIETGNDENIYAFYREKNGDMVVVFLNLSAQHQKFVWEDSRVAGKYKNVFSDGDEVDFSEGRFVNLDAWGYLVLERTEAYPKLKENSLPTPTIFSWERWQPYEGHVIRVEVVGNFNDWRLGEYRMKQRNGKWMLAKRLCPGKYEYKFAVVTHKRGNDEVIYELDPSNDRSRENSEVTIEQDWKTKEPEVHVEFTWSGDATSSVAIAGTFNNWCPRMNLDYLKRKSDGSWSVTECLQRGTKYDYKFIVDKSRWEPSGQNLVYFIEERAGTGDQ